MTHFTGSLASPPQRGSHLKEAQYHASLSEQLDFVSVFHSGGTNLGQLYHLTDRKVRTKSLHFRILPQLKARLKAKESKATSRPVSHHQSCVYVCVYAQLVSQSCLTLCDPMDYSPPSSSVHRSLQARILEWLVISFSRGSSQLRDQIWVSCIAGRCFMS